MARERRDGGERPLLFALLAIVALGAISIVLLVLTQGDPPARRPPAGAFVTASAPVPSAGPQRDQLLGQCAQLQAALNPITAFTVTGLASVPVGAPTPTGTELVTCGLSAKGARFVASRFANTTAAAMGANIESAGWSDDHSEVNAGLRVTLYSQNGTKQISVVDLGGGQVVVVYS